MIKYLLHIVLFICIAQLLHSQENGVTAFSLPVRNSLKFNKYAMNPTFSFVRESNKQITFTNKREWVQFNDAPQTYLFSYSGRFSENIGASVGLFQQNYGVMSTFGGVLNFAYNAVFDTDSNLTFGMNIGFYSSGINEGNVVTNFPDPALQDIANNSLLSINPGINYGIAFFDFGLSLNNLVSYNLKTSKMIEENPEQGIQAHIMYTGYVESRGFFDQSKFSTLVRSEFKKDKTVISGIAMIATPKGVWAQAGYNTLYGMSFGLGFNLSTQISIEYNYEKAMGNLSNFGSSHEFTLAYKFKNKYRYAYSDEDAEEAILNSFKSNKRVLAKDQPAQKPRPVVDNSNKVAKQAAQDKTDETQAKATEEARIKLEQEAQVKAAEEARVKQEQEAQVKAAEEARIKLEQEAQAKAVEEAKIKLEHEEQAKAAEVARVKLEQEAQAKAAEEARIKLEKEAQAKAAEEARIKIEQEAQVKATEEARVKLEQEAQAKAVEEATRIKLEQEASKKIVDKDIEELDNLTKSTQESAKQQQELLNKLQETVASRDKDFKDLKEENDLGEQGIYKEPKPFKSASAQNAELESLKSELDNILQSQSIKISQLENLYNERLKNVSVKEDSIAMIYLNEIVILKKKQKESEQTKASLMAELEVIKEAIEVERKRRIKRAIFDDEQDRYVKDRATLERIKNTTSIATEPLIEADFDFGKTQDNIQILKDVKNIKSGYYLVIAVHNDVEKRDEFLRKAISAGQTNVDFFYDVNTSNYYIYYKKFDDINSATNAIQTKGNTSYNGQMSIVKIEN